MMTSELRATGTLIAMSRVIIWCPQGIVTLLVSVVS